MTSITSPQAAEAGSPSLFETLLKHVPEPLLVVNAEGRILFRNHKAVQLFGPSGSQIDNFSIVNYLRDWFTLPLTGSVLETTAVDAHGHSFTVELSLAPVETPDGPVLIALVRDLTRRYAEIADFVAEQESLRERIQELSHRERDIRSEMSQAATILEAHLPARDLKIPKLQVSWKFSPCSTLGGDMIKLLPVSQELVGFCILDVSGHGVPASLLAISLARSLSTDSTRGGLLETSRGKPRGPREILSRLNKQYQVLHEGEQFVTLIYGILDLSLKKVRYVSAGHPHPLRVSTNEVCTLSGPINPPVGVLSSLEYEETDVQLAVGDSLFLYTDGVTETRNPDGEMFGESRLLEFVRSNRSTAPALLLEQLYAELGRFRGGEEQTDDVTSLVMTILE